MRLCVRLNCRLIPDSVGGNREGPPRNSPSKSPTLERGRHDLRLVRPDEYAAAHPAAVVPSRLATRWHGKSPYSGPPSPEADAPSACTRAERTDGSVADDDHQLRPAHRAARCRRWSLVPGGARPARSRPSRWSESNPLRPLLGFAGAASPLSSISRCVSSANGRENDGSASRRSPG